MIENNNNNLTHLLPTITLKKIITIRRVRTAQLSFKYFHIYSFPIKNIFLYIKE